MEDNWSVVYSYNVLYHVEILKSVLQDNDIESVIINRVDSNYLFGDIDLYVSNENLERAKEIIASVEF